jgi:hypothetical protein
MKYEESNLIENKFNPTNGYLFGTTDEEFEYVLQQPNKKILTLLQDGSIVEGYETYLRCGYYIKK